MFIFFIVFIISSPFQQETHFQLYFHPYPTEMKFSGILPLPQTILPVKFQTDRTAARPVDNTGCMGHCPSWFFPTPSLRLLLLVSCLLCHGLVRLSSTVPAWFKEGRVALQSNPPHSTKGQGLAFDCRKLFCPTFLSPWKHAHEKRESCAQRQQWQPSWRHLPQSSFPPWGSFSCMLGQAPQIEPAMGIGGQDKVDMPGMGLSFYFGSRSLILMLLHLGYLFCFIIFVTSKVTSHPQCPPPKMSSSGLRAAFHFMSNLKALLVEQVQGDIW